MKENGRCALGSRARAALGASLALCVAGVWGAASVRADSDDARAVVGKMIEAHGGMDAWKRAPTVSFEDTWFAAGSDERTTSRVVVEQGARRAYVDFPASGATMSWDGKQAWSRNWDQPAPPRFIALLGYYFFNLPWLTLDPGVVLERPGTGKLWDDPANYITIRMSFAPGVGDTPDDYYILYIHPETYRLTACRYVVTYAELLPEGVRSSPEHILVYDTWETVDGLVVPTLVTVYERDKTPYYGCEIGAWSFRKAFDAQRMVMSDDAQLDTSKP